MPNLKPILTSIQLYSRLILDKPLYPYQVAPANALIDSCLHQKGLEFLWVFPRQSGKDETIAQSTAFLLTLFHRVEAAIVHVYPTAQQLPTGTDRLRHRLANAITGSRSWTKTAPIRIGVGRAQVAFFSGHPLARAEGATANVLLIVNEVQDQIEAVIERRFTPMRASTNATALYVGTVRTTADYLWRVKTRLEALQAADNIRRVFLVTPDQVGANNPSYAQFVAGQVALKGRQHPSVKTELFNEPLDTAQGLFPERRRALMRGTHSRMRAPILGEVYLGTLDVGGQDEAATAGPYGNLARPGRDYTVATMFRVVPAQPPPASGASTAPVASPLLPTPYSLLPSFDAVDVFVDHGSRHFQDAPGQPALFQRLLAWLNHWNAAAVIADTSGVGQGIADALAKAYPRQVVGFDFARDHGKARLGTDFLALIETGRFKYFTHEGPQEHQEKPGEPSWIDDPDAWAFFEQCRFCGYELAEGQPIERGLRWSVPATATTTAPGGTTEPVHDDRLLSAALIAEADRLIRAGQLFVGSGQSAVIRRPDDDAPQAGQTTAHTW